MGLPSFSKGQKKILSYEILFGKKIKDSLFKNIKSVKVKVNVKENVPIVEKSEYVRLWSFYQSKLIYNCCYPHFNSTSLNIIISPLSKIVKESFNSKTNCFERMYSYSIPESINEINENSSNIYLYDVYLYSDYISSPKIRFYGEFYSKGPFYRNLQTHFPVLKTNRERLISSGIALLQYCIDINKNSKENLDVLAKTARNLLEIYGNKKKFESDSSHYVYYIPQLAYYRALGTLPKELNNMLE